jgi:hypothetical protein
MKSNFKPFVLFCGIVLVSSLAYGSSEAESRNYLQYIPATPFVGAEDTSHEYMRFKEPVSPWKMASSQPTWEEVMLYKQKLESLRQKNKELEDEAKPEAPKTDASFKAPKLDTNVNPPPLKWEELNASRDVTQTDITVSPWFNIPTPQSQPNQSNSSDKRSSDSSAEKPMEPAAPSSELWIKKPVPGGTELYIPYSSLPGVTPPPTQTQTQPTTPSAVIYSQPKAAGTE